MTCQVKNLTRVEGLRTEPFESGYPARVSAWNSIFLWVLSQNGLFSECPHRQRAYLPRKGYLFTSRHVRQ